MFYGIIQLGSGQYGGSYNASGTRTATVGETMSITDAVQKTINKTIQDPIVLSETVQKSVQSTVFELIEFGDLPRIFVEGNDVTYWSRVEKDNGVWSPINKQY